MKTFCWNTYGSIIKNQTIIFLPEIHLPVVFSHFLYQVHEKPRNNSSRKNRIYPKSTLNILKVISSVTTPVHCYFASNNLLFRIAILKFSNKKLFLFEKNVLC